jgi:hypothetical protein
VVVVGVWAGAAAVALVLEQALYKNHLVALVVPLALLVALHPPPLRALVVVLVVTVPWQLAQNRDVLWPEAYDGADAEIVAALDALPSSAEAISDEPGLVWRAGLTTPPLLNDAAQKRISQHLLTPGGVLEAAARPDVCAIAITSARFEVELSDLGHWLPSLGYRTVVERDGKALWIKSWCVVAPDDRARAAAAPVRSPG